MNETWNPPPDELFLLNMFLRIDPLSTGGFVIEY